MGFGQRWTPQNAFGMDSPPPGTYTLPSVTSTRAPRIVRNTALNDGVRFFTPGPGSYDPLQPLGKNAPKIAIRSRIHRKNDEESPGPNSYSPKFAATQQNGFAAISFGIGERMKIRRDFAIGPGPGSYNIATKLKSSRE
jgi:hypothetical protein